jgi:hydroxyacylglutathione hydrolase
MSAPFAIHEVPVTPFMQNCTLWVDEGSGEAIACDVGDAGPVQAKLAALGATLKLIVATHGHLDHIGGTAALKEATGVPFLFPSGDDFWRLGLPEQASMFGGGEVDIPEVDGDLKEGDAVRLGAIRMEVLHCPGHTPGHVVFHDPVGQRVVAGDVLFQGSVGRTDFPRGSFPQLEASIRSKLYTLPAETLVHCGHGPTTTIGEEARCNPFVRP